MRKVIESTNELEGLAEGFVKQTLIGAPDRESALIVGLFGELGSGKTTFTQEAAKVLNIKDRILSPTFILERVYDVSGIKNFTKFIHIDAYRLEGKKDLDSLGWEEIIKNPQNIIFIEWADRVLEILPKDIIKIHFEHKGGDKREITIEKYGQK